MKKLFTLCAVCACVMSSFAAYNFYQLTPEGAKLYYEITKSPETVWDYDAPQEEWQYDPDYDQLMPPKTIIPGELRVNPQSATIINHGTSSYPNYTYYTNPEETFNRHIAIPDTVIFNNQPYIVIEIGANAFYAQSYSNNYYYLKSLILPRTLRAIGQNAFYGALPSKTGVTNAVTIPVDVDSIAENAFYNCAKLDITWLAKKCVVAESSFQDAMSSILFGTEVTEVPANLCRENRNIYSVTLPYSITNIGDYAFFNCSELSKVAIGEGVEHIGRLAFSGCTSLTHIISAAVEPPVAEPYAFIDIPLDVKIEVPCGKISDYAQAPEWSYFWYMAETIIYKATVLVEDYEQGNATVDYDCESATFKAMPNAGYKFKEWSNGRTENPLTLPMISNIALTALFEAEPQAIELTEEGADAPIKLIENGSVYVLRNGVRYTIIGERVQ